MKTTAV
jgi:nucleoside-diphosphate kinase